MPGSPSAMAFTYPTVSGTITESMPIASIRYLACLSSKNIRSASSWLSHRHCRVALPTSLACPAPKCWAAVGLMPMSTPSPNRNTTIQMPLPTATAARSFAPSLPAITVSAKFMPASARLLATSGPARGSSLAQLPRRLAAAASAPGPRLSWRLFCQGRMPATSAPHIVSHRRRPALWQNENLRNVPGLRRTGRPR